MVLGGFVARTSTIQNSKYIIYYENFGSFASLIPRIGKIKWSYICFACSKILRHFYFFLYICNNKIKFKTKLMTAVIRKAKIATPLHQYIIRVISSH